MKRKIKLQHHIMTCYIDAFKDIMDPSYNAVNKTKLYTFTRRRNYETAKKPITKYNKVFRNEQKEKEAKKEAKNAMKADKAKKKMEQEIDNALLSSDDDGSEVDIIG